MVVSEDCHGTALHKGLEIAHGSELRTLYIYILRHLPPTQQPITLAVILASIVASSWRRPSFYVA